MDIRGPEAGTPPAAPGAGAESRRRNRRTQKRLLAASVSLAALLTGAPAALADTTVSIEFGQFGGSSLTGRHVFIRDTASLFDEKMDVEATHVGDQIVVTDAVGKVHAKGICQEVGATARCPDSGVVGLRFEGGVKNDVLTNSTNLVSALAGNKGNDVLQGGSSRDELIGQDGDDDAFGGDGADTFFAEPGADRLDGEQGSPDTINYAAAPARTTIHLEDSLANDGVAGESDQLLGIENARGSKFDDLIVGSDGPNTLSGLGGNDAIRARGGDDRMNGGLNADVLDGDEGIDAADYTDRTARVIVEINANADDGNADDGPAAARDFVDLDTENLLGGSGPDKLVGHESGGVANALEGRGGDDSLFGRDGDDVLRGGAGNDDLDGAAGADLLNGGTELDGSDGDDGVTYESRSEAIAVTLDDATPGDDGGASDGPAGQRDTALGVERVKTGSAGDQVTGDASNETIETGDGADTLTGNGGNDSLVGGAGQDAYSGGTGQDRLDTVDGALDDPISCGEDPAPDPVIDSLDADGVDVQFGIPADCEQVTLHN